jgi:Zn-dependent peptidase ImmA (M78 family)
MQIRDLPRKLAKEVLAKYWDRKIPVDPKALAEKLKAKVVGDNLNEVSGQFTLSPSGPIIRYNAMEPLVRQRFSIAHELGHYVLAHGDAFRDTARNFTSGQFDRKEVDANRFAAEILMPEEAVNQLIRSDGISDLSKLAREFHVSEAAMKYRLKNLGWITE